MKIFFSLLLIPFLSWGNEPQKTIDNVLYFPAMKGRVANFNPATDYKLNYFYNVSAFGWVDGRIDSLRSPGIHLKLSISPDGSYELPEYRLNVFAGEDYEGIRVSIVADNGHHCFPLSQSHEFNDYYSSAAIANMKKNRRTYQQLFSLVTIAKDMNHWAPCMFNNNPVNGLLYFPELKGKIKNYRPEVHSKLYYEYAIQTIGWLETSHGRRLGPLKDPGLKVELSVDEKGNYTLPAFYLNVEEGEEYNAIYYSLKVTEDKEQQRHCNWNRGSVLESKTQQAVYMMKKNREHFVKEMSSVTLSCN